MLMEKIKQPGDLKRLPEQALPKLAEELRRQILETTSKNGGHLASSLGVVELTIALHRVFSPPKDSIVWDVGHQSYAHKLLTGRAEQFSTLRKKDGISGFPKSAESPCDAFVAGHSSTSISAALGIATAKKLRGDNSHTIAVIGDGALSGGMAYEGLNNAGRFEGNLIVILNDNEMSISKNTGSMARYLASVRNQPGYFEFKDFVEQRVRRTPVVGEKIRDMIAHSKKRLKERLYPSTFFEELGFVYLGPVDGYDLTQLQSVLRRAATIRHPVFIHVQTQKGHGYSFAEQNPGAYHGVPAFDLETGEFAAARCGFSKVVGHKLKTLAAQNQKIVAITAAMKYGTGLAEFAAAYPKRFFDVGIAEEHAVTFAGGLAAGGSCPVFAVYSTFLQRGYDQVLHDLAIENRHVVLCVDRAGIVGEDGETHQGLFDTAFLSEIPHTTIFAPSSFAEAEHFLEQAVDHTDGIAVLRYPRGGESLWHKAETDCFAPALHKTGQKKATCLLVSYGRITAYLDGACDRLNREAGIAADFEKLVQIHPLPEEAVTDCLPYERIFFFEEGIRTGGIGQQLLAALHRRGWKGQMEITAIDGFVPQSTILQALKEYALDEDGMVATVRRALNSAGDQKAGSGRKKNRKQEAEAQ